MNMNMTNMMKNVKMFNADSTKNAFSVHSLQKNVSNNRSMKNTFLTPSLKNWFVGLMLMTLGLFGTNQNVNAQQTQTYNIALADLTSGANACGTNNVYWSTATGGFTWTDVIPTYANVSSITLQLAFGTECTASTRAISLNSVSQGSVTTIAQCTCTPTTLNVSTINLSASNYTLGGTNTISFPTSTSGLNATASGLNGYYAVVTVNYSTFSGPTPTLTSFTPTSGSCTNIVTVNGTNFNNGTPVVKFNGVAAATTYVSATQVTAVIPAAATTGPLTIQTGGGIATAASNFTVNTSVPTITAVTPTAITAGNTVTITGTNLSCPTAISIGGTPVVSFNAVSSTQVTAVVGYGATGSLSLTTAGGTATFGSFTYTAPQAGSQVNVAGTSSINSMNNNVSTIVDPAITVTGNGTITDFRVQITDSYTAGDILEFTGSLPSNVTYTPFNTTTRSILFTGTLLPQDWSTILQQVKLKTSSAVCFPEARKVTFIAGSVLYNPLNGHYYIKSPSTNYWTQSRDAAAASSYFGLQGYLATITSASENSFVSVLLNSDTWIGGSDNYNYINQALGYTLYANQAASEGKFYWVTGPEKGTQLTTANGGSAGWLSTVYNNWDAPEPNNSWATMDASTGTTGEHYMHFLTAQANWNDYGDTYASLYSIFEYGGMAGDNLTSTRIFTRNIYVNGAPTSGISGGNVNVCAGSNSTTLTLPGFTGTVNNWQSSTDNFLTTGNTTNISSTSTSLTVTNITTTTYYRAVVTSGSCSALATSPVAINVSSSSPGVLSSSNINR